MIETAATVHSTKMRWESRRTVRKMVVVLLTFATFLSILLIMMLLTSRDANVVTEQLSNVTYTEELYYNSTNPKLKQLKDDVFRQVIVDGQKKLDEMAVLPPVTISKSAQLVHDFTKNISVIMDPDVQQCYIMSVNPNEITKPSSLCDMLEKMTNGYYLSQLSIILNQMHVVKPALDITQFHFAEYIIMNCADYQTFKLEKNVVSTTAPAADTAV